MLLGGPAPASAAVRGLPDVAGRSARSPNWSGYAQTGSGPYTSVSASWTVPTVDCAMTPNGAVSFWVGLDGYTDATVEQTGTEATCEDGRATYAGWHEMFPDPGVNFAPARAPVLPGDVMSASAVFIGDGRFRLTLINTTRGWSRSVTGRRRATRRSSVEVITEAPSGSGGVFPLADFGVAEFTNVTVDGGLLSGSAAGVESVTMERKKVVDALPSALLEGAFTDSWSDE
jgi:hypothetical protein